MQKDIIYIDVEDDITAIIGKVKAAKEKVVALVPPKRIGVLQSAVNLRLLARAGTQHHKHVVLITNNQALMSLASSAKIPVAKNLQSKPELAEIPALIVDDEDDIIDGKQLPVGELAKTSDKKPESMVPDTAISDISIDDDTPKTGPAPASPRARSGIKVPSFSKFRKRIFIFGGLGVVLFAFLIWAIWFAPHATITISARTTERPLKAALTVGTDVTNNMSDGSLKSISHEHKDAAAVEFDATGTEEKGEKATGTMTLTRTTPGSVTVPYGTGFSNGDCTFVSQSQATVPGATPVWNGSGFSVSPGTVDVKVQATQIGEGCNLSGRSYTSAMDGISANGGDMAGGSKRQVKIVTQADVIKAQEQLNQQNSEEVKKKLKAKFTKDDTVIDDSFAVSGGDPQATPGIGQEAPTGKAKLSREAVYTMVGIANVNLDAYLKTAFEKTLNNKNDQRVYDNGLSKVQLNGFKAGPRVATVSISATGQVGPKIDDNQIKQDVKGKRYGEVQADLKGIDGVNDVDTKFSPFWVQTVPDDINKITIQFKLKDAS